MFKKLVAVVAIAIMISPISSLHADEVEIYLTDMLDNTQVGYCVDIAKGKE